MQFSGYFGDREDASWTMPPTWNAYLGWTVVIILFSFVSLATSLDCQQCHSTVNEGKWSNHWCFYKPPMPTPCNKSNAVCATVVIRDAFTKLPVMYSRECVTDVPFDTPICAQKVSFGGSAGLSMVHRCVMHVCASPGCNKYPLADRLHR